MAASARGAGRLLLTGVPGWLSHALLLDLEREPLPGLTAVRCLLEPTQAARTRLDAYRGPLPVEGVVGDLRSPASLAAALDGVDLVLHAAGLLHVRRTRDWYDVNTRGTEHLASVAAQAHTKRFVLISSNAAAGKSERAERLLTEAEPPRPLSHYGRSKWLAEQALLAYAGRFEAVILRPSMFYGPPVPDRHIDVYRRLQTGVMPLVGDGNFARSLTYIDNLVQGCRLALSHPAAAGQTYYIADRPAYTTRRVVEAMAAALDTAPRYLRLPRLVGPLAYTTDMALARLGLYWQTLHLVGESDWHVGVSSQKAVDELGYTPSMELEEGMRRAVAWCYETGKLQPTPWSPALNESAGA